MRKYEKKRLLTTPHLINYEQLLKIVENSPFSKNNKPILIIGINTDINSHYLYFSLLTPHSSLSTLSQSAAKS